MTSIKLKNIDVHAIDSWYAVDPMLTDDHGGGMDESSHGTNMTTTNKGGNGVTDIGLKISMSLV